MADHDTPNIDKLDKLRHRLDADNPDSVDPPLNRFQHPLSTDGSNSVNPLNAGGENLTSDKAKKKLKGILASDPENTGTELSLDQWLILYQSSSPLLKQAIEQKIAKLPKPNEGLQAIASNLRANQRASASAVLNLLFYILTVYSPEEDKVQSELLHGLLMALSTRLDDKIIHPGEEARTDYDQFNITMISREVDLEDSSVFPEIEQQILRSQQNPTDVSSVPLHKPIGLLLYLNPDPQARISTKKGPTLQYMCSETKPFVIPLYS